MLTGPNRWTPASRTLVGFLALILLGTLLLKLPWSTPPGKMLTWTDAVFTSTSAVCVTGLIVVQTPYHFTGFGEAVILILFQLGGIGIIVGSSFVLLGFNKSLSLDRRLALQDSFVDWPFKRVKKALFRVFTLLFVAEGLGAVILAWEFSSDRTWGSALWHGLFHSVSAICNAGFSLNPDSLVAYQQNPVVVLTVGTLIVIGGLGFVVLAELTDARERNRWSLHTRTLLLGTVILVSGGTVLFAILEPGGGFLAPLFQSITARTAGFNTVNLGEWGTASIFILFFLMFVGAGPASTAGGVKITTLCAVISDVGRRLRHRAHPHWLDRRLPLRLVNDSVVMITAAFMVVGGFTFLLSITETGSLEVIMFEVLSALGTVGLSLGLTDTLSTPGKWIIISAMFIGRLGPLTFVSLLIQRESEPYTFPEERMMIG